MVNYNPKEWVRLIFTLHKTDTVRKLAPSMFAFGSLTAIVCIVEIDYLHLEHVNTPVVHSLLGFVISLLLVFRTNTAYERWWEGRKLWGALVNNTRNLGIKLSEIVKDDEQLRTNFRVQITNFVFAMKEHLRGGIDWGELEDTERFKVTALKGKKHIPNLITQELFREMNGLVTSGRISEEKLIVLNGEYQSLLDVLGGCERIKKTPIPYSYSSFLKKFIFIYTVTMPFGFISSFGYWTILIVIFVFYVLASLELIAEEIEDPFGTEPNDLPTDDIANNIKNNLIEIFETKN